ncbi:MAG TPA: RdgB/HAM1 family non-canonical purine NTP pyrophosphatase [Pyrinomonadaceae bacterium]|nr:RdgB/HAM1 family non-canonical purine NTP pyrophosphatase [Pyrinomonadaceae bacterium]
MSNNQPFEMLLGTRNRGKVREIHELLADLNLRLHSLDDFPDVPEVEETGATYEANSSLKALTYAGLTKLPTLGDDSGLEVDALGGAPGPFSARFGGNMSSDKDRIAKLLLALNQAKPATRSARFICCLTLAGWDRDSKPNNEAPSLIKVVRGELEGQIIANPRGDNGFGYDPVFVPNGFDRSLGELPIDIKNRISHRANALDQMKAFLSGWIRQT